MMPCGFPGGRPVYDYFTGVADQTDVAARPPRSRLRSNTRTIMQIQVGHL